VLIFEIESFIERFDSSVSICNETRDEIYSALDIELQGSSEKYCCSREIRLLLREGKLCHERPDT